jgi:hypothetical protein
MNLYFSSSGIPEMANLSAGQRRFVRRGCIGPLWVGSRFRISNYIVSAGAVILGFYLADMLRLAFWGGVAVTAVSVVGLGYLHDMLWLVHFRPEVARFIQAHEAEIRSAA